MKITPYQRSALTDITNELSAASSVGAVVTLMLKHAPAALGCEGAAVMLREGDTIRVAGITGFRDDFMAKWREYPMRLRTPGIDALESGQPVFLESVDDWRTRYPAFADIMSAEGYEAYAAVPLIVDGRGIGVLTFNVRGSHAFSDDERVFVTTVAEHCAVALHRAGAVA